MLGALPPEVWLVTLFMSLAALGIGIAKDLPDVAGDRAHGIFNLAVRRGPGRALAASTWLWALAYLATAALALVTLPSPAAMVLAAGHGAALFALARSARAVRPDEGAGVRRHYRLLWRLLYAEYLLMPLVAALAARMP
jgi:homogentisate phytyltransferase/homogentisate geranylgeranyltransferase